MEKLKNFWYYHKTHLLIAAAVVAVALYLGLQSALTPEPDYHIGLVQALPLPDAQLDALKEKLSAAGEDCNGDGEVLVQIHTYYVDLADDSENAGVNNAQVVAALDADLIGNVSGLFLLEDVDTFRRISDDILEETVIPWEQLSAVPRRDASERYTRLVDNLK